MQSSGHMLTTVSMAESYVVARREPGPQEAQKTEGRGGKSQRRWRERRVEPERAFLEGSWLTGTTMCAIWEYGQFCHHR